jgi:hypothetical protein
MEKDRVDSQEEESTSPVEEQPRRRSGKKSRKSKRSGQAGPLDQLPVDNLAGDALGSVTNTLGGVTGNALNNQQQQGGGGDSGKDTLRLRLDLNLDIEIQLKARIHGDLELALL